MDYNRYSFAGWLAITQAVLFLLAFGMSIIQKVLGLGSNPFPAPSEFGPSEMLFVLFTAFAVYTIYMFRHLLNERYNFHGIDTLITISICWSILFQIGSLFIQRMGTVLDPQSETIVGLVFISFFMVIIGIVDILIAVQLLKAKDTLNDLIQVFAYISIVAGILEVVIVLSPIALILVPVSSVLLGMIFLRETEQVELV